MLKSRFNLIFIICFIFFIFFKLIIFTMRITVIRACLIFCFLFSSLSSLALGTNTFIIKINLFYFEKLVIRMLNLLEFYQDYPIKGQLRVEPSSEYSDMGSLLKIHITIKSLFVMCLVISLNLRLIQPQSHVGLVLTCVTSSVKSNSRLMEETL